MADMPLISVPVYNMAGEARLDEVLDGEGIML